MEKNFDFNVTITTRNEEFGEGHKEKITRQLKKLKKQFSHIIDANVILDKQNSSYKVDISLQVPGLVITSRNEDFDKIKAIDNALEKVKTQLKKLKSKVVDHRTIQTTHEVIEEDSEETLFSLCPGAIYSTFETKTWFSISVILDSSASIKTPFNHLV